MKDIPAERLVRAALANLQGMSVYAPSSDDRAAHAEAMTLLAIALQEDTAPPAPDKPEDARPQVRRRHIS